MRWWQPSDGEVELWEWWAPLLAAGRRARRDLVPWPLNVDEFRLEGRIDRPPRPSVWVYRHRVGGGRIRCDSLGRTYVLRASAAGAFGARHVEVDVRRAVWAAGLPDVVRPVWFSPPPPPEPDWAPEPPPSGSGGRRHLHLVGATEG
jgi:hypothetical protein